MEEKRNDLCERLFEFAVSKEAQSGSSKADFTNKVRVSLREMRESNYWLRIIKRTVKDVNISKR